MTRLRADALLLLAAMVWGLAFVFQKRAMEVIGPFTFIAARGLLAALALAPVAWLEGRRSDPVPCRGFLSIAAFSGLIFFLGAALQQYGLKTASVTNTGFLTALYVVVTPFVAWIWHRKTPGWVVWPAAAFSFAGTWMLGGGFLGGLSQGDVYVAICALFWALHVVVTGYGTRYGRPVSFTCLQFVVVGMMATVAAVALEAPKLAGVVSAWKEIAYVGLFSGALTFTWMAVAMKHTPPSEAAVIVSTESLFGAVAGAVLLGERLPWMAWIGAVLIVGAILMVQIVPVWEGRRRMVRD